MKKILALLIISAITFTSCEGDRGPQGPQGPPGEDGANVIGTVIDFEGVDFNEDNDYSFFVDFNDEGVEVFESDAVFVYLKDGEDGEADGQPVEVFRLLPQTYYVDDGEVQYNYDFTFFDVNVFMEGTANFEELEPEWTDDQVIRIIIAPADFAETTGLDMSSVRSVMNALNLHEDDVKKASVKKK